MAEFATMDTLDLWYHCVSADDLRPASGLNPKELAKLLDRFQRRAHRQTSLQAFRKLAVSVDGRYRIRPDPPVLSSLRDLPAEYDVPVIETAAHEAVDELTPRRHSTTIAVSSWIASPLSISA
jgi:hypothetical protein